MHSRECKNMNVYSHIVKRLSENIFKYLSFPKQIFSCLSNFYFHANGTKKSYSHENMHGKLFYNLPITSIFYFYFYLLFLNF